MPGHEYLSDEEIASIAAWVAQLDGQQSQNRSSTSYLQEKNK
jgi:mono/diheme cytochrome c family protein